MMFPEVSLHLPPDPRSVTRARHFVRDVLVQWGLAGIIDDAQLGTSELVANAVSHAHTPVRLTIRREEGSGVLVDVHDLDPGLDRGDVSRPVPSTSTCGRGLLIVEAIATQWGIERRADGKSVWFRMDAVDERSRVAVGAGMRVAT